MNTNTIQQQLPVNTILNGDCIHVMRQMPANSVDFILTDPPYLVNFRDRDGRTIQNDLNADWLKPAMAEAYRLLKEDRLISDIRATMRHFNPTSTPLNWVGCDGEAVVIQRPLGSSRFEWFAKSGSVTWYRVNMKSWRSHNHD